MCNYRGKNLCISINLTKKELLRVTIEVPLWLSYIGCGRVEFPSPIIYGPFRTCKFLDRNRDGRLSDDAGSQFEENKRVRVYELR